MKCQYSYPAGTPVLPERIGQTGDCLVRPDGAYVGKTTKSVWYFCGMHRHDVNGTLGLHAQVNDFPLREVTLEEAAATEVMES